MPDSSTHLNPQELSVPVDRQLDIIQAPKAILGFQGVLQNSNTGSKAHRERVSLNPMTRIYVSLSILSTFSGKFFF